MKVAEEVPEKGQIEREHMERVNMQNAAEEEALKFSRTIKGPDLTNYKNRKYKKRRVPSPKRELSDKMKLMVTRRYQFFTGFMGFVGTGVIFLSIYIDDSKLYWSFSENLAIEMDSILLGCALTLAGVVGIIGFQHKHDKISHKIRTKRKST
ncbi:MAG: hypothetical protein LBB36_03625 [Fibromonadaceae bacterium]|nr:hypothetical protein [Fibromonadaceae bacterium]